MLGVCAVSFSAADILAEFVEAGGCLVESQRWLDFDGCRVMGADRRQWDTPEERERNRRRYAQEQHSYFSAASRARRMVRARQEKRMAPVRAALLALRLERKKRRTA